MPEKLETKMGKLKIVKNSIEDFKYCNNFHKRSKEGRKIQKNTKTEVSIT